MKKHQVGFAVYLTGRTDDEGIKLAEPEVLQGFAYTARAHRLTIPLEFRWVCHFAAFGALTPPSVGVKGYGERLPWHKGWLDMIKAWIWLWKHRVSYNGGEY